MLRKSRPVRRNPIGRETRQNEHTREGAGMEHISWPDFERVEIRVGTVTRVEPFPEARRPAYKVWADFGPEIGVKKSSARSRTSTGPKT